MVDQRRADLLADAGQVVDDAGREAGLLEHLHQLRRDDRRLLGRLHDDGVAGDEGGGGHAAEDRQREVPRRDDDGDAARLVEVLVLLAGHVAALRLGQAEHLAGVVLAEVDRLGDVGVGLAPGLAALVDLPGGQLEAAAAQDVGGTEEQIGARRRGGVSRQAGNAACAAATACVGVFDRRRGRSGRRPGCVCDGLSESIHAAGLRSRCPSITSGYDAPSCSPTSRERLLHRLRASPRG